MDNFTLVAIIIIVFWLAAIAFYLYLSRQQREISEEIDDLKARLDEDVDEGHASG